MIPNPNRVAFRYLSKKAAEVPPAAPSAEHAFFDNPEKREVREFAETSAISNDPAIATKAAPALDQKPRAEAAKAKEAPPTPTEIVAEPGGDPFSTLNRYVVETKEPVQGVPEGHAEIPKHPVIIANVQNMFRGWFGKVS